MITGLTAEQPREPMPLMRLLDLYMSLLLPMRAPCYNYSLVNRLVI